MTPRAKAQWQIQFCVVLWGCTAILGKLITLSALPLVWWRMLVVTVALSCVPRVWRGLQQLGPRLIAIYAGIGVIVSLHWLTFYSAIKLANASVAATCIAIAPVFLALVEPWVAHRRFNPRELLLAVAVVPGVALVVGGVPTDMHAGIAIGVVSALFVALFGSFNKRMVDKADAITVTFVELGTGAVFLTVLAPLLPHSGPAFPLPSLHDALLLLTLAIGCTLLPFALALSALRHLSAFNVQIVTNLEPIYAIVLAIALLGEQRELDAWFYLGLVVILGAVFALPWLMPRAEPAPSPELLGAADEATSDA